MIAEAVGVRRTQTYSAGAQNCCLPDGIGSRWIRDRPLFRVTRWLRSTYRQVQL
jgi:hypothetical protein